MRISVLLSALYCALVIPFAARAQSVSYSDVLVVVNGNSSASEEVGDYFATRRGIPESHICRISASGVETIDSLEFKRLQWQIEGYMRLHNLTDSINYIVTTMGCPLRVISSQPDQTDKDIWGGTASFEDCLVLINGRDSTLILAVKNSGSPAWRSRYFDSHTRFRRDPQNLPIYLVTRLDGYTVDNVKSLIRKAETPVSVNQGKWVLDVAPDREAMPNGWLRSADTVLRGKALDVLLNEDATYLREQPGVVGYASWGSSDPAANGAASVPDNQWLDGSIAETFSGVNAQSFRPTLGVSSIADWLENGATGVSAMKGYTDNPVYLGGMARPQILFDRYTSGWNMAESFYAASSYVAWRQVIVGDPKMQLAPGALVAGAHALDLKDAGRYASITDTLWLVNISNGPVELRRIEIDGESRSDFHASPDNGTISPGDSIAIAVTMRPSVYGRLSGRLRAFYAPVSSSNELVWRVDLLGNSVRPLLDVPGLIRFEAPVGSPTATRTFSITNLSSSDSIEITGLHPTGGDARSFVVEPAKVLPCTLAGGEHLDITVTYNRLAGDSGSALLEIYSSAARWLELVELRGATAPNEVSPGYEDVLLVVNDASSESREIANYFAQRRGIPERHICNINASTSETIDSLGFRQIQWQIQRFMAEHNLIDSINYIVTTKGCPLRVTMQQEDDQATGVWGGPNSFEDCLVLINGRDSAFILAVKDNDSPAWNAPYYNSESHFRRHPERMPIYLVTRLDGYTVQDVKGLIDRAEHPARVDQGEWVIDIAPSLLKVLNGYMSDAGQRLEGKGLNVFLNEDASFERGHTDVIGYTSWGSNDPSSGGGAASKPGNTWLNGAIAETFVSTGGRSFMPGTSYEQSLIADLIAEGVSGVKGYIHEPTGGSLARVNILFDRYASGFNLAESFYAASLYLGWRQVVIGDPKMRLRSVVAGVNNGAGEVTQSAFDVAPNPFNTTAVINFRNGLMRSGTRIELLDIYGRVAKSIEVGEADVSSGRCRIDAEGLATGIYLCRLTATRDSGEVVSEITRVMVIR